MGGESQSGKGTMELRGWGSHMGFRGEDDNIHYSRLFKTFY